jgi:hypothetical protein
MRSRASVKATEFAKEWLEYFGPLAEPPALVSAAIPRPAEPHQSAAAASAAPLPAAAEPLAAAAAAEGPKRASAAEPLKVSGPAAGKR